MKRTLTQDRQSHKAPRVETPKDYSCVLFRLVGDSTSTLSTALLEKYLCVKLSKKTKWNKRITISEGSNFYVYNLITRKKEFCFDMDNTPINAKYISKILQLSDGSFMLFQSDHLYVCNPNGKLMRKFRLQSGNYKVNIHELPNNDVIFTHGVHLYVYNRRTNTISQKYEDVYFRIAPLYNGNIAVIIEIDFCILDQSLEIIKRFEPEANVVEFQEYKPNILLCSLDDVGTFITIDLETEKEEPFPEIVSLNRQSLLKLKSGKMACLRKGGIDLFVDHIEKSFTRNLGGKKVRYMTEVSDDIIGYSDTRFVYLQDTITGVLEKYELPTDALFVSFVKDII